MSREYAMSRVRDALEQSDNNHMKAHRLILEWLKGDHSLFVGLAAPHMNSIVTHAIAHVTQPEKPVEPQKVDLNNTETGEMGDAILSGLGLSGKTGSFGEGNPAGVPKPSKASQSHVDALHAIAQAAKDKK